MAESVKPMDPAEVLARGAFSARGVCLLAPGEMQRRVSKLLDEATAAAIETDRTGLANALDRIKGEIAGRAWLLEGRGPYEWDDERYKAEAGQAMRAVQRIANEALLASGKRVDEAFAALRKSGT